MFGVQSDFPDISRHQKPSNLAEWVQNELVGQVGRGECWCAPIMMWITPSSLQQLCNCYPPFCGAKPKFVEQDGRRARWNPLAWGVFSPPTHSADTDTISHTHPHIHAHTKCKLRDLGVRVKGRDALRDTIYTFLHFLTSLHTYFWSLDASQMKV